MYSPGTEVITPDGKGRVEKGASGDVIVKLNNGIRKVFSQDVVRALEEPMTKEAKSESLDDALRTASETFKKGISDE